MTTFYRLDTIELTVSVNFGTKSFTRLVHLSQVIPYNGPTPGKRNSHE